MWQLPECGSSVILNGESHMKIPPWVQQVIDRFDARTEPHSEIEIAEALANERGAHGDLSDEDWKGFLAENSVFYFREIPKGLSIWGTYFAPMVEFKQGETTVCNPDIAQLDADTIAHWEYRATIATNPVMKARYADAAWDLAKVIANGKPNYKCAESAIDAYVEATDRHLYRMEIEPVQWLVRALHLARSIRDPDRITKVADAMFAFYKASLQPKLIGIWISLFDNLYGDRKLISESREAEMIHDLESMLARMTVVGEEFDPYG